MNHFTCQNPKRIHNVYTDEDLFVPCGKCELCMARKANSWTERLEIERSCHPYCLFGTLTYSDEYLPRFDFSSDGLVDQSTGEVISFNEFEDYYDSVSYNFLYHRGCLPVGSVYDCQRFIKRLRSAVVHGNFRYNQERRKENPVYQPGTGYRSTDTYIRYFLCEELGESTLRPHYHFLIFTSSKWFAEHAKDVVASCWCTDSRRSDKEQLGIVDCQNVLSSASAYVAQYINSFVSAPKIYSYPRFRPFKLFSKSPAIGSLCTCSPTYKALFDSGSTTFPVYRRKSNQILELPIPKSLCDRLYPRINGFDAIPSYVGAGLYALADAVCGFSFEDIIHWLAFRTELFNDGVTEYLNWQIKNTTSSRANLRHLVSVLKRVAFQSHYFGVTPVEYYYKIVAFYKSRNYEMLKSQLENNEKLAKLDYKYLLLNDLVLLDDLSKEPLSNLSPDKYRLLKSYGYDARTMSLSDFFEDLVFDSDVEYRDAVSKARKQIKDSKDKKCKNEYLEHRQKDREFMDFLVYYHSIKDGLSEYNERVGKSNSQT